MEVLLDPKAQYAFFARRKENNRLRSDKNKEKEDYQKLSEKSGLSVKTLKDAAYGRTEDAFISVASADSLSNKEKNQILSGAVGKIHKETNVTQLPTFTFTKEWDTPVRETVCSPVEGWCHHKKVTTRGGGQRVTERVKNAKRTNIDFSNISNKTRYSDFIVKPVHAEIKPIEVNPVLATNYLKFFK